MVGDTKGKGPFTKAVKTKPQHNHRVVTVPFLGNVLIEAALNYVKMKCDAGHHAYLTGIATMRPEARLVRNINTTMRLMLSNDISDVLDNGITEIEHGLLHMIEKSAIADNLLGAIHALLNIRERQRFVIHFGADFKSLRADNFQYLKDKENE